MLKRLLNPRYARFNHMHAKRGFWTNPHGVFNRWSGYGRYDPSGFSDIRFGIAGMISPFAGYYSIKFVLGALTVYKLKHDGEANDKRLIEGYIKNGEFITKRGNYKLNISDVVGGMNVAIADQSDLIYIYGVSSDDQLRAIAVGSYKEVCSRIKKDNISTSTRMLFTITSSIFVFFVFVAR